MGSRPASRCGCGRTSRPSFPPSVGEDGGGTQGCVRAPGCMWASPLPRAHGLLRWQVPLPGQLHRRAHPAQPQCSPRACFAHLFHPGWGRPDRKEGQGQKAAPNRGHTRTRRTAQPPALSCCGPGPWSDPSENTRVREGSPSGMLSRCSGTPVRSRVAGGPCSQRLQAPGCPEGGLLPRCACPTVCHGTPTDQPGQRPATPAPVPGRRAGPCFADRVQAGPFLAELTRILWWQHCRRFHHHGDVLSRGRTVRTGCLLPISHPTTWYLQHPR